MNSGSSPLASLLASLKEKGLIVFGLGREGWSTYSFLRRQFPEKKIILGDDRSLEELDQKWRHAVKHPQTEFVTEIKPTANSIIFKTPGVPPNHPLIKKIAAAGAKLSSNTQLFFELFTVRNRTRLPSTVRNRTRQPGTVANSRNTVANRVSRLRTVVIGVTGTKGKSTTTSVIHHVLQTSGHQAKLGGNIGKPALDLLDLVTPTPTTSPPSTSPPDFYILEFSSHQLTNLSHSPNIAVVQGIAPEHLDYYPNFDAYLEAKTSITRYQQKSDWVFYNQDNPEATQLAKLSPAQEENKIGFNLENKKLIKIAKKSPLLGQHNLYNIIPAILIGRHFGLSDRKIKQALKSFQPLPHRLEFVAEINGVKYYDDSIATNPHAAVAALKTFADQPTGQAPNQPKIKNIILLAGGHERQQDFSQLAQAIKASPVKAISLFPPTGQRLLAELEKVNISNKLRDKTEEFSTMKEAVYHAQQNAEAGDVVLLSPGAASFGLFKNYKDRGEQFKAEVLKRSRRKI